MYQKKKCPACSTVFETRYNKIYCSANCRQKTYYHNTKDDIKARRDADPAPTRLSSVKARAKLKGVECTLTVDDVRKTLNDHCHYCQSTDNIELERMFPSEGYIPANIISACHNCNAVKSYLLRPEEMVAVVKLLKRLRGKEGSPWYSDTYQLMIGGE